MAKTPKADKKLHFDEYQLLAYRTANTHLERDWRIVVHALGLTGEAGEVVDNIKKRYGHGHNLDLALLEKELGDVLWYIAALATEYNLSLGDIAAKNILKLKARYGDKFSVAKSKNRRE